MKHLKIKVFGKVQRVGFRFSAMKAAYTHDVRGFVKNMDDGSIYIEAEGEEENLRKFSDWCRSGPIGSKVERTETAEGLLQNYTSFDIRH
jgi:acylphosphatase